MNHKSMKKIIGPLEPNVQADIRSPYLCAKGEYGAPLHGAKSPAIFAHAISPSSAHGTSAACGTIPKLVCFLRLLVQSSWVEKLQRVCHRLGLLQDSECYRSVRRCCVADNGWRLTAVVLAVAGMVISARVTNHEDVALFE